MKFSDICYLAQGERISLLVLLSLIVIAWIAIILTDKEEEQAVETLQLVEVREEQSVENSDSVQHVQVQLPRAVSQTKRSMRAPAVGTWPRLPQKVSNYTRVEKFAVGTVLDLNGADTVALKKVPGIGSTFARRIVRYRELLGGYYTVEQLAEVYGIDEDRYVALYPWFTADTTAIRPLLINTLPYKELLRHPYLNASQVRQIDRLRRRAPLTGWTDLMLLEEFSEADRQRLSPYLSFEIREQ